MKKGEVGQVGGKKEMERGGRKREGA